MEKHNQLISIKNVRERQEILLGTTINKHKAARRKKK